jgi:Flp pilus assembly protein TadG
MIQYAEGAATGGVTVGACLPSIRRRLNACLCNKPAFMQAATRARRWPTQRDRAVAALEFALIAPVFILMVLGMLCFGFYFLYLHEVQELAASAARASVSGLSQTERDSLARQFVSAALANSTLLNAPDLTVATASSGTPATLYAVTITYNLKDTPVPMLASLVSLSLNTMSRTSTIAFGGT